MTQALTRTPAPILVLGPAHSGKSGFASQLLAPDQPTLVVGVSEPVDAWLVARHRELRDHRPGHWETVENPPDLTAVLATAPERFNQILIDSFSQWLAGRLVRAVEEPQSAGEGPGGLTLDQETEELCAVLARLAPKVRIVVVSSELGACPPSPRASERRLRRMAGLAHQRLAALSKTVIVVHAGIPTMIKPPSGAPGATLETCPS